MPQETRKARIERITKEAYPRMVAIAKIEVLFDQIIALLPLTGSQEFLKETLIEELAVA